MIQKILFKLYGILCIIFGIVALLITVKLFGNIYQTLVCEIDFKVLKLIGKFVLLLCTSCYSLIGLMFGTYVLSRKGDL